MKVLSPDRSTWTQEDWERWNRMGPVSRAIGSVLIKFPGFVQWYVKRERKRGLPDEYESRERRKKLHEWLGEHRKKYPHEEG